MRTFLVCTVTLLMVLLELLAGNRHLPLALPVYSAVYFAVVYRKSAGIISAAAAGLIIEAMYGREWMLLTLIFPAVVLLALSSVRKYRRQMPAAPLAAGAVCGATADLGMVLVALLHGGQLPGPDIFSMLIFQIFTGALFMLIFTLLADFLAFKCNLPRFISSGNSKRGIKDV